MRLVVASPPNLREQYAPPLCTYLRVYQGGYGRVVYIPQGVPGRLCWVYTIVYTHQGGYAGCTPLYIYPPGRLCWVYTSVYIPPGKLCWVYTSVYIPPGRLCWSVHLPVYTTRVCWVYTSLYIPPYTPLGTPRTYHGHDSTGVRCVQGVAVCRRGGPGLSP